MIQKKRLGLLFSVCAAAGVLLAGCSSQPANSVDENINTNLSFTVNGESYYEGETVTIQITDSQNEYYVATTLNGDTTYRALTEEERSAGSITLTATNNTVVKFYKYGLTVDDLCVIAGDTNLNRVLLTDFLPSSYADSYCIGFGSDINGTFPDSGGCICAANDLWKVYMNKFIYSGYYKVSLTADESAQVKIVNSERAFLAEDIPDGAPFPVCDSDVIAHIMPSEEGTSVQTGFYYVKAGTVFTNGVTSYEITNNTSVEF